MALYQESSPRFLHCAVQVEENCYLWGGHFSEKGQKSPALSLQVFHSINEKWGTKTTTGDPPSGLLEGACTTASKSLYHFGGNDGNRFYNSLHCLESDTLQWRELHASANRPMPKSGCGIVTYFEEELSAPSLIVFAGYGKPAPLTKPEARFIPDTASKDGKGWTDEIHLFNLTKCEWSTPLTAGPRPTPCSNFSFTAINHHMAVLFGGVQPERGVVNDVYIINFQSMEWTKLERPEGASWPVGRHSHAACCLNYGEDDPQLLVTGGVYKNNTTLKDAWVLDINSARWSELDLPEGTQLRFGHTVTAYSVCPGRVHTTTFGGCPVYAFNKDSEKKIAETTVMEFESNTSSPSCDVSHASKWVLASIVSSSSLGSPDRLTKEAKMKQEKNDLAGMDKIVMKDQQVQTEFAKTVEQHVQTGSTSKQQGYLRGVEVIDHITFTYTGRAQSFEWLNHGFKIHFPENVLPPGVDECRVHVKASLSGQFDFPRDAELVSGLYWLSSRHVFTRPVTVDIQHCAQEDLQQQSRLTYIVASCSQEELPYQFKTLEGGVFSPSSRYGSINLTHFSGLAITSQPHSRQSLIQKLTRKMRHAHVKRYCAQLYYSSSGVHSWEVYFAVMWDLELHINAADAKYAKATAKAGPSQTVMFEGNEITLDIAVEGVVLENGWTITPYTHPGITKDQVDHFVPGSQVPSCQLYVEWTGQQEQPVQLLHRVKLLGAKEPNNFFLIRIPAPQALPEVAQQMPTALGKSSIQQSVPGIRQQIPMPLESSPVEQSLAQKYAGLESEPDLSDLMNEIASKVSAKWKDISIQLGLTLNDQKHFMELTLGDPKHCFTFVFTIWKSRATRPYSWSTVIQVLESPAVDEIRLAQELRTKLQS